MPPSPWNLLSKPSWASLDTLCQSSWKGTPMACLTLCAQAPCPDGPSQSPLGLRRVTQSSGSGCILPAFPCISDSGSPRSLGGVTRHLHPWEDRCDGVEGSRGGRVGCEQPGARGGKAGGARVGVQSGGSLWRPGLENVSCGPQIHTPLFLSNRGSASQPKPCSPSSLPSSCHLEGTCLRRPGTGGWRMELSGQKIQAAWPPWSLSCKAGLRQPSPDSSGKEKSACL